jgi:hypothetical protein
MKFKNMSDKRIYNTKKTIKIKKKITKIKPVNKSDVDDLSNKMNNINIDVSKKVNFDINNNSINPQNIQSYNINTLTNQLCNTSLTSNIMTDLTGYKCYIPLVLNTNKAPNNEYSSITVCSSITSIIVSNHRQIKLYKNTGIDNIPYIIPEITEDNINSTKSIILKNGLTLVIVCLNKYIYTLPNEIFNNGSNAFEWWNVIDLYEYTKFDRTKTVYQNLCLQNTCPYYNINKKINLNLDNTLVGYITLYDIYSQI